MSQTIEFFFDIGSPYSYLAATQMPRIAQDDEVRVDWKPFLLGGVFKAVGNRPPAALDKKRAWMLQDLNQWAEHYGVPFRMSSHFPINSIAPQRALVAARMVDPDLVPDFALALYADYWAHDVDVSKPAAISAAADRAGFDTDTILEMTQQQEVKDRLRELSDEAVARGAFGAPTFFVGDRMFWGNDRLLFVEKAVEDGLE